MMRILVCIVDVGDHGGHEIIGWKFGVADIVQGVEVHWRAHMERLKGNKPPKTAIQYRLRGERKVGRFK
jgi:hypothetical protein